MSCYPCSGCGYCSPTPSCSRCNTQCIQVVTTGCPIQLDFSCVLYHKSNSDLTELDGLELSNGATLELFAEAVDEKVKQLDVLSLALPYLKSKYVVNNLQQFMTAVDTELSDINDRLTALEP